MCAHVCVSQVKTYYSETSLIRHLYNPTFSLIQPLYEVQSPYVSMVRGTPLSNNLLIQHYSQVPLSVRLERFHCITIYPQYNQTTVCLCCAMHLSIIIWCISWHRQSCCSGSAVTNRTVQDDLSSDLCTHAEWCHHINMLLTSCSGTYDPRKHNHHPRCLLHPSTPKHPRLSTFVRTQQSPE